MLKMYGFESERLLEAISDGGILDVPKEVEVVDIATGELDNGNKWATLVTSSSEELEALRGIGMEDRAGKIKVSLKGYNGEDVEKLIGKKLDTSVFAIDFDVKGKFKQIVGAKFISSVGSLKFSN